MAETTFDTEGLESYVTDAFRESETGVWLKFPGGYKFRCLRAGGSNKRYATLFQRMIKPYRRQMDKGTMDLAKSEDILRQVYCKTVILDWEGVKAKGKAVSYTPEAGMAFFAQVPELFSDIVTLCTEAATFQEEEVEEAEKVLGEV